DYGPCAYMDGYDPMKVFSSIDQHGRYAYANQPQVALWNLAQFASCLIPLMGEEAAAIEEATASINRFADMYQAEWLRLFGQKIGIAAAGEEDAGLIHGLLNAMAAQGADFTRTFRGLTDGRAQDEFADRAPFETWAKDWQARIARETGAEARMLGANPAVIPRNHRVEEAIQAARKGDYAPFHQLNRILATPFALAPEDADYARAPLEDEVVRRTFCGT
ncbi:MAG: protein adenylyltransferase SelO family protein, partial [Albidovulum sp.]